MGKSVTQTYRYGATREEIMTSIPKALEYISAINVMPMGNNAFKADIKVNFQSWGESISISVQDDGTVHATSQCRLATQIIDWGKNKKNLDSFFLYLHNTLVRDVGRNIESRFLG